MSRARVGSDPDGRVYRSFFDFPISALKGYHIEDAYVQMKVDHTWSCDKTPNSLYQAGSIATPRASYSTSLVKYLATVSSNANEGAGCSDAPQPDMTVNFFTDAVTSVVNGLAAKGASNVVFGIADPARGDVDHGEHPRHEPAGLGPGQWAAIRVPRLRHRSGPVQHQQPDLGVLLLRHRHHRAAGEGGRGDPGAPGLARRERPGAQDGLTPNGPLRPGRGA
ncbi:hypothetical protein [Actinoplanes solisilvae]|uniref:hypothetical protein n=1 Tax=Actinoplanes solisilvae TaxID=2486853 RepID=UPI000FDA8626|nr:hypothetical protein [Actinoplanes solisilvae]